MIPWNLRAEAKSESWNAAISRAVSELLPPKSPNKERLAGEGFASELAEALMRREEQVEDAWSGEPRGRGIGGPAQRLHSRTSRHQSLP
jgi:hypothetical protein